MALAMSPTGLDYLTLGLLVLLPLLVGPVIQTLAGASKIARYISMLVFLAFLGVGVLAVWTARGRPLSDLGLEAGTSPGSMAATGLTLGFVIYVIVSLSRLADPERATQARSRLRSVVGMLPDTRRELMWFIALGLVAGMTEELVYRGYILLGLAPNGPWVALLASTVAFGIPHLYQGWAGGAGTALFGLALGLVTLLAGSIFPAMVIHAAQDVGTGVISHRLGRGPVAAD
jgi:membrane protease YdiL (CAAX protease family)